MRGVAIALSLLLLACTVHRTDFVFIQLADPEADATELGEPSVEGYRGEPVPLRYRYLHARGDVHVALGRESFVPSLRVEAPSPIHVEAGPCSTVLPVSPNEVAITWNYWRPPSKSCISVGDPVRVTISFTDTAESLAIAGRAQQAGTFRYVDSL
jgi:hypothetical protein